MTLKHGEGLLTFCVRTAQELVFIVNDKKYF